MSVNDVNSNENKYSTVRRLSHSCAMHMSYPLFSCLWLDQRFSTFFSFACPPWSHTTALRTPKRQLRHTFLHKINENLSNNFNNENLVKLHVLLSIPTNIIPTLQKTDLQYFTNNKSFRWNTTNFTFDPQNTFSRTPAVEKRWPGWKLKNNDHAVMIFLSDTRRRSFFSMSSATLVMEE